MYILTGAALVHRISVKQRKIEIVKTEMAIKLAFNHQTKKKKTSVKQPLLKLLFPPISFQLTAVPLQC